ncbi:delta 8-(E)-sphingolipid desaturase [[Candida] railenensis]|uniref:Delta 8-(E)-sphingolipid desaturase n=1 Tax=[Candida] railenensis TaxID=45579 RepID=A0A9P0QR31_9ASCO|nr:delta 8-(E)-sphingolipid desaturase [[Candida] railenensis]
MSKLLSRDDVAELISNGRAVVIYKDLVLDLTSWLSKHPGGDTAVHHMVGRDATDEMNAYHSIESISSFKNWKVGRIDYMWENMLPPIQGGKYEKDFGVTSMEDVTKIVPSVEVPNKGIGYPIGQNVKPVVPSNVIPTEANKDEYFPVESLESKAKKSSAIVDPQLLMNDYDNALSQAALGDIPSLDYATQQLLRDEYVKLHDAIIDSGLYQFSAWNYGRELIKISSLFLYSFSFFKLNYIFLSALFMGMAWQQMTFIAHDSGHVSLTHNYQLDNIFGMIIADWFGGLSLGWWKRNHNVHHLITNDPVHDPDIQHLPFFAVSVRLFENVYSTYYKVVLPFDKVAEWMIPIQNYTYYPILCFGRFNLYALSWMHLLRGLGPRHGKAAWFRYFELAGLSFFFWWFFYLLVYKSIDNNWDRFVFVMVSHVATMLVHVQITLSHFAMSTSDLGLSESFPSRQVRTTMDVDCPEWLDFLHGGLQFQAIHHLFPRLPRHNLRKAQPLVIEFCEKVGLKYSIYGFGKGNEIVIGKLADIGKQCSIMLEATKKLQDH